MARKQKHLRAARTPNRMLRMPDVMSVVGLSKATIYRLVAANEFPKAKQLSERARAWSSDEVQDWIDSRI